MSPELYRIIHIVGVLFLFFGLGGILATGGKDGAKPPALYFALHGVGLVAMLVAGIGFAHRSNLGWPNWMLAKIGCWVLLGALPVLLRRGLVPRGLGVVLTLGIACFAVWLVQMRPF